jgi:uncharacterized protein (TIGR03437 family)
MKKLVFVLAMVLSATITALAQTGQIQSRIVDIDGNPVPDVTISESVYCGFFGSLPPNETKTYSTDPNGNFMWPQLRTPGTGAQCAGTYYYTFTLGKAGYVFTRSSFFFRAGTFGPLMDERLPLIHATTSPTWDIASAASFRKVVTTEMIVAGFGSELATSTDSAGETLPMTLAGRKILVRDSAGVEKAASLFYVSPQQINLLTPEGLAEGSAVFRLLDESDKLIKVGLVEIKKVSHGIFTANFDGAGPPSAYVVRVKPPNVQFFEPVAEFDQAAQKYVPALIDHGPVEDILILVLFGTGWRNARLESSRFMVIDGNGNTTDCSINYLGKQPTFPGLDQANVVMPRSLTGKGDVDLMFTIDGFTANKVRLKFK